MAKIIPLKMGADLKSPSLHEEETRVATLMATVEHYVPDFVRGVEELAAENDESSLMILHQDAFAANYGSSRIYERARNLLSFITFRQTGDEPRSPRHRVGLSPSP